MKKGNSIKAFQREVLIYLYKTNSVMHIYKQGTAQKSIALLLFHAVILSAFSQTIINTTWKETGTIKTRNAKDIQSSTWSIGGETLDRDYTDYQSYKKYLGPLGAKRIRLQGGWAKCEKVKGVYNFTWLDSIIPDAASRGVFPWVELSYGNPIYSGGGEAKLAGHIPTSPEALQAWDAWVKAMVSRYKAYVPEWEIWNEPDLNPAHTGKEIGEFYLRTAKIVRTIQPEARLIALGMASVTKIEFVKDFMEYLKANNGLDYVNIFTYHGYSPNPDLSYHKIEEMRKLVWSYKPDVVFMQGENGAPSTAKPIGAMREFDWSELTQAKWDLRRMLGDHGRGIATNLFTISDIHYAPGDHMVGINTKGILKTNPDKTIERPKLAYKAAQFVFSLFDNSMSRDTVTKINTTQHQQSFFSYNHKKRGGTVITIWQAEDRPAETYEPKLTTITVEGGHFQKPVFADLVTGKIYELPKETWRKEGNKYIFSNIPVTDYPMVIADASSILLE